MSRARYATRWHEDNCRPQCYGCNVMQQGRQYDFGLNLDREREGLADEMHQLSINDREVCHLGTGGDAEALP
jgi:hypothetical protein